MLIGRYYCKYDTGSTRKLLTIADCIDLLGREIVEAPIGLVDSDSERLAMTPVVIFSELCNWNDFFVPPDSIPEAVLSSARCLTDAQS